jgi:hypothetical protein
VIKHEQIETNAGLLIALTMIVISIGGLVEIVPTQCSIDANLDLCVGPRISRQDIYGLLSPNL